MSGSSPKSKYSVFSLSCAASVFTALYLCFSALNLYKLMYPLAFLDVRSVPESELVGPLWDKESQLQMKVYLSTRSRFHLDFLKSEYPTQSEGEAEQQSEDFDSVLLWGQDMNTASSSKSFLLTTLDCKHDEEACLTDSSYKSAKAWLDHAEHIALAEGGLLSELSASAGEGIESTSVLLSIYNIAARQLGHVLANFSSEVDDVKESRRHVERTVISLSPKSQLWAALQSNSTLHIHAVVTRDHPDQQGGAREWETIEEAGQALARSMRSQSLLLGHVDLVKYDLPHHVSPPKRILYHDILYVCRKFTGMLDRSSRPPWDMAYSQPDETATFQTSLDMKRKGEGYPYWKPEVAVKYVNDAVQYPSQYVDLSGMAVVQLKSSTRLHPTGFAHMPALHVDEIGLTSEKYIPVNETLTSLPLRISFDRSDMENDQSKATTATAGGISPARWRLLTHFSSSLESQKELGFEQSDIDDVRRLIADTNVLLLSVTLLASGLHMLFEFLTFKSEVSFWKNNKDLTGLSVRSLFLDMIGQVIIVLYLIDMDSSLLMTVPAGIGCLIALWKCQRGAGFKFVRVDSGEPSAPVAWWNVLPRMVGYELRATRLHISKSANKPARSSTPKKTTSQNLAELTIEMDRVATRILGSVLLPVVIAYTIFSLVQEEHTGWYSWLITSSSSAVYALGFVLMTPQLFVNYKLKSVAHLPWRVLVYKFLNTFIDDLFAFIIRMPTMARLSCFRDDIVFIVYLYQRWLYPVDSTRPVEGGDGSVKPETATAEKKKQ